MQQGSCFTSALHGPSETNGPLQRKHGSWACRLKLATLYLPWTRFFYRMRIFPQHLWLNLQLVSQMLQQLLRQQVLACPCNGKYDFKIVWDSIFSSWPCPGYVMMWCKTSCSLPASHSIHIQQMHPLPPLLFYDGGMQRKMDYSLKFVSLSHTLRSCSPSTPEQVT